VGGRERLVRYLGRLAAEPGHPPTVMITHHVEEIPPGFTHALLLRAGRVVASGPLHEVIAAEQMSEAFGLALCPGYSDGRWTCRARPS
jgi:iron complex transport system ATP-binding protein